MTLKFTYAAIEANDLDTEIYVNVSKNLCQSEFDAIEDAIASYIEENIAWGFTQMISDVLSSFGYDFEFLEVDHEFVI